MIADEGRESGVRTGRKEGGGGDGFRKEKGRGERQD